MEDLSQLPNIGEVLVGKLSDIGITRRADIVAKGSIETVIQIGDTDTTACYNMMYALEGAIRGVRWHVIPNQERKKLKEEFDLARELK